MKMKAAIRDNQSVDSKIQRSIHRANLASRRERGRERERDHRENRTERETRSVIKTTMTTRFERKKAMRSQINEMQES